MRVGFLHSLIRKDEKFLLEAFKKQPDVEMVMIDDRQLSFSLGKNAFDIDVVLERSINHSRALHALRLFESMGITCVNSSKVATVCGDKLLTSIVLKEHGVPQPEVRVAFTEDSVGAGRTRRGAGSGWHLWYLPLADRSGLDTPYNAYPTPTETGSRAVAPGR